MFSNFLLCTSDDDKNALSFFSQKQQQRAHETVARVVVLLLLLRQERQQSGFNGGYTITLYCHSRIHMRAFSLVLPFANFCFFLCFRLFRETRQKTKLTNEHYLAFLFFEGCWPFYSFFQRAKKTAEVFSFFLISFFYKSTLDGNPIAVIHHSFPTHII